MKKNILSLTLILSLFTLLPGCCKKHHDSVATPGPTGISNAGPPVYIYKTRADYNKYVPVILSPDKKTLVSYPGIKDIYYKGELAYPTPLNGGFLLDNRGISKDAAFLKLTYEEYSRLNKTPTLDEFMGLILDKDPFTEIYYCGTRYEYSDLVSELNKLIETKNFSKFRKVK